MSVCFEQISDIASQQGDCVAYLESDTLLLRSSRHVLAQIEGSV